MLNRFLSQDDIRSKEHRQLLGILLLGILLRLLALPFTQVVDADAVSRIFIAEDWLKNPTFFSEGIWLPFHHYLNAFTLAISGEHLFGPKILHILLSCLVAIPLYYFTKREYSAKGAWFTALIFILIPVVFRNSFLALSGLPHALFIAAALNASSKSIRNTNISAALRAGLYLTLAAGFRYEAWLLIPILFLIFTLFRQHKLGLFFLLTASIFPLFWMTGNYLAHEHILYGLPGNYNKDIVALQNTDVSFTEKFKRIIYFPFIWFFAYSPFLVVGLSLIFFKKIKQKIRLTSRILWTLPFWVFLIFFAYKAYEGTLLMQSRFIILLLLFSTPFASLLIENVKKTKGSKVALVLFLATLIPLSYVWMQIPFERLFAFSYTLKTSVGEMRAASQNSFKAIPQVWKKEYLNYSEKVNANLNLKSGFVLDFISFENTYYLAYKSELPRQQIRIIEEAEISPTNKEDLVRFFKTHPNGVMQLKCNSPLFQAFEFNSSGLHLKSDTDTLVFTLQPLAQEIGMGIFTYKISPIAQTPFNEELLNCPEPNSADHYKFLILNNDFWKNDVLRKAKENNITFEEQLEIDVQKLIDTHP
ncbi:Dolichyl-phosphate-mannose-protein mannosyltransferase [Lishizhenia tianjinensis]|uniref:Dolichyl-phosphate-mannose-protein mannosyltransferase n=2 Tax=Lishizhenia tianjinensis TaxID=477690 RepID=A0A1I7A200_9FLAO|nr:Dolichyl-phosphate-mannose-protein mannosyltransferase [Lishizhenia tianjinensis]